MKWSTETAAWWLKQVLRLINTDNVKPLTTDTSKGTPGSLPAEAQMGFALFLTLNPGIPS